MHDIDFGDEYDGPPACDPVPYVVRNRELGKRLQRELDETLRALPEAGHVDHRVYNGVETIGRAVAWLLDRELDPISHVE